MDRLEELVRDTLAEHADAAPAALTDRARRPGSRRPRWTLWAPIAAAAAMIAIVGGLSVAQSQLRDAHPAGPGPQPSIPPAPPVPAGYKLVSYHGIQFAVPIAMTVVHQRCGYLRPNQLLALDPGALSTCHPLPGPKPTAGATYIQVTPASGPSRGPGSQLATTRTTTAGQRARIGYGTLADYPGVTGVLMLSKPDLQLTVTAPTHTQVTTMLGSVRLAPVDALGCPSREPDPADNPSAASLAPAGARTISLCGYAAFSADLRSDFWLTRSAGLPATQVAGVLRELDTLPGIASTVRRYGLHQYVRVGYPDGTVRWLAVEAVGSPSTLVLTDGHHRGVARDGGTSAAGNKINDLLVAPGTGWSYPTIPESSTSPSQSSPSPTTTAPASTTPTAPAGYK